MFHGRSAMRAVFGTGLFACAALLLARAFHAVDLDATLRAVAQVGVLAPLTLLPFVAAMSFDAAGMFVLLRLLGRTIPWPRILPIRLATEALHVTAPAGFLVADSATAKLLDLHFGVPLREGATLAVARKWLVMRAHAMYLVLGALWGASALAGASSRGVGGAWLVWLVGLCGLIPLGLSVVLGQAICRGSTTLAVVRVLSALPWPSFRRRLMGWRHGAAAVDGQFVAIGQAATATWTATLAFFGAWLFESVDTSLILRLVGGPPDFALALGLEVGISMLRSVGNVAPAGLGVQDAGYATLLPLMGVSADLAAAFVVVKRAKELVWIGIGYALLGVLRRPLPWQPDLQSAREALVRLLPRGA